MEELNEIIREVDELSLKLGDLINNRVVKFTETEEPLAISALQDLHRASSLLRSVSKW